jgi:hypothetical protein
MKPLIALLGIGIGLWLSIGISEARMLNVPADFQTIQAGIDSSRDGDTVLVARGEYSENINFGGKAISVIGSPANVAAVVLDGNENGSVVRFDHGEDARSVLNGFVIRGGSGSNDPDGDNSGGGILVLESSPTLTRLMIRDNRADYGAGIYLRDSSPIIRNVDIRSNRAGQRGGGLYCTAESSPIISYVTICDNLAVQSVGAGIYSFNGCRFTLTNCTVAMNGAQGQGDPAGIMMSRGNHLTLRNCLFWGNGELQINLGTGDNDTLLLRYCDIQGGRDDMRMGAMGDFIDWNGNGNFSANPLFREPDAGDYRLTRGSPCIDAGDPDSPNDLDRTRVDIGAYYFNQNHPPEVIRAIPSIRVDEDCGTVTIADLDTVFADQDGDGLAFRAIGSQLNCIVIEENIFQIHPSRNFNGDSVQVLVFARDAFDTTTTGFFVSIDPLADPPSPFSLLTPRDSLYVSANQSIHFSWEPSVDPDLETPPTYQFRFQWSDGGWADTTILMDTTGIDFTFPSIPNIGLQSGLWWVSAISQGDTVRCESPYRLHIWFPETVPTETSHFTLYTLHSPFPNPFNSSTTIRFSTSWDAYPTRLAVYGIDGRLVKEFDGKWKMENGTEHTVVWEAVDLPGGIYLIRLESGAETRTVKAVLMK